MIGQSATGRIEHLDIRGLECPFALAAVDRAISTSTASEWEVLTDHTTTARVAIPQYCRERGLALEVREVYTALGPRVYQLRIMRTRAGGSGVTAQEHNGANS